MAGDPRPARRRPRSAAAAAALLVTVATGCWPAPGQGPDRSSYNPAETTINANTVTALAPVWTATTDPAGGGRAGPPVVSDAGVHVSDGTGVYGFDRDTGARLWRRPDQPVVFPAIANPVADGDRVLYSAGMQTGFGGAWVRDAAWVDARTGAHLEEVPSGPVTGRRGSRLATYSLAGSPSVGLRVISLEVVDTADPAAGWSGVVYVNSELPTWRPATLGTERLYHAGDATEAYGETAVTTGVRAYSVTPPAVCSRPPEGVAGPAIPCPLWSTPTDAPPATSPVLAPDESVLYVATDAGTLLALDAADGHVLWRAALGARPSADPALAAGTLYVPLANGDVAALRADGCGRPTCRASWRAPVGGAGLQPAVAGGVVFVGTDAGRVVALPAAGCGRRRCGTLWHHDLGAPVTGAPAVSDGRLYVGAADRVVAFTPQPPRGQVTVTPTAGLSPGDEVTVRATGFPSHSAFMVMGCSAGILGHEREQAAIDRHCSREGSRSLDTGSYSGFTLSLPIVTPAWEVVLTVLRHGATIPDAFATPISVTAPPAPVLEARLDRVRLPAGGDALVSGYAFPVPTAVTARPCTAEVLAGPDDPAVVADSCDASRAVEPDLGTHGTFEQVPVPVQPGDEAVWVGAESGGGLLTWATAVTVIEGGVLRVLPDSDLVDGQSVVVEGLDIEPLRLWSLVRCTAVVLDTPPDASVLARECQPPDAADVPVVGSNDPPEFTVGIVLTDEFTVGAGDQARTLRCSVQPAGCALAAVPTDMPVDRTIVAPLRFRP